eukprot:3825908-Karenia_brevis.AAC.1
MRAHANQVKRLGRGGKNYCTIVQDWLGKCGSHLKFIQNRSRAKTDRAYLSSGRASGGSEFVKGAFFLGVLGIL